MKIVLTYLISGFLAWLWVISTIEIHRPAQYFAAGVLLFLFCAPGLDLLVRREYGASRG